MSFKKSNAPLNTVTHNLTDLSKETGNIYETVAIIGKRANQISQEIKQEISRKLSDFAAYSINANESALEEVYNNQEQTEISRYYERLPKPTLIATQEYIEDKVYVRNPLKDKERF